MPLLGEEPWDLVVPPEDLDPNESVYKVPTSHRGTLSSAAQPMVLDHDRCSLAFNRDYLKQINLYRKRIWTCKMTGKSGFTYEEALLSEDKGKEGTFQLPKELIAPALQLVQFSPMSLDNLATVIYERLRRHFSEGEEVHGQKDESVVRCRILKVIKIADATDISYGVAWLDGRKNVTSTSIEKAENLSRKKQPFSKKLLKSLILASTSQSSPWVLHDSLAQEHGISTEPPEVMKSQVSSKSSQLNSQEAQSTGVLVSLSKSRPDSQLKNVPLVDGSCYCLKDREMNLERIKYPIDDLLVMPVAGDPTYTERPIPCTKFSVPMECVGNLIMVWDFCSTFYKLLHLSPFSLEDFENAIVYNTGDLDLIFEVHLALLNVILTDDGKRSGLINEQKMPKITSANWVDHLCHFFEKENQIKILKHLLKLKDASYYKLDVRIKLIILGELVSYALITDMVRGQLDEYIEQTQALVATKREKDLEELQKRREEKKLKQIKPEVKDNLHGNPFALDGRSTTTKTKICWFATIQIMGFFRNNRHAVLAARRANMRQKQEAKIMVEKERELKRSEETRRLRAQRTTKAKEAREKKLKEEKQEHFDKEIEKRVIRTKSLGKDRNHNIYWFFKREGRVFVESDDHVQWGFYSSQEELDGLMASLNPKGEREMALKEQLEQQYTKICQ
ncbi:DDT domain-containing protein [Nymphaea thermarum]|nr:DDT domain-containing protein [Nymphaea thermarum]